MGMMLSARESNALLPVLSNKGKRKKGEKHFKKIIEFKKNRGAPVRVRVVPVSSLFPHFLPSI